MIELANPLAAMLAVLVFAPILAGAALWLWPAPGAQRWGPFWLAVALTAALATATRTIAAAVPLQIALGGHAAPLGIEWYLDGLTVTMLWLTQAIALVVGAYLAGWTKRAERTPSAGFPVAWMLLWGALNALFLSADLFNVFVLLEVCSLAGVVLVASQGGKALISAIRYLLFAMTGSILYLLGVALSYADTGLLALRPLAGQEPAPLAAALLTVGLLVKAAMFPLHGWLPPAHAAAPAPASAVLSALVVKAAAYLLVRYWSGGVLLESAAATQLLAGLGTLGVVYGSVLALRQSRLKRVIAYSTVAQLGYVLLLPALAGALAWQGVALHLVSHGLAKASMFLAAGNLMVLLGSDRLSAMRSPDRRLTGNLMAIGLAGMSLAGMPPTAGFVAKWWLVKAALETGQWWWAIAIAAGGLLTAAYVTRILRAGFANAAEAEDRTVRSGELPWSMTLAPWVLAAAALVLGFLGSWFGPLVLRGTQWAPTS